MPKHLQFIAAVAALCALVIGPSATAQDTKPADSKAKAPAAKAAPTKGDASAKGQQLYPQPFFDFMLKQRTSQGQADTPELRNAVRDELNTRELLVREAKKKGLDKDPNMKAEMDLTSQT